MPQPLLIRVRGGARCELDGQSAADIFERMLQSTRSALKRRCVHKVQNRRFDWRLAAFSFQSNLQSLLKSASPADGHKAAASEGVKAVLSSFLKRRNLRIPRTLIESFARQNSDLAGALLCDLASFSSAVRTSLYPEAVGMLDTILSRASQVRSILSVAQQSVSATFIIVVLLCSFAPRGASHSAVDGLGTAAGDAVCQQSCR